MNSILKSGSCSVVLGSEFYKKFLPEKKNKLIKVTKIIKNHNEYKKLEEIRLIENYEKYFCIPDELIFLLNPSDNSYKYIKNLFINEKTDLFHGQLSCSYVNYGGDKDLFDTLTDLIDNNDYTYWSSYQKILNFTKYILEGLQFLHKKKLCHLDIKPENIIVNTINNTYKIVDFGFCDQEPFNDFISDFRGTPGYFPRHYPQKKQKDCIFLPKIKANDTEIINGVIPLIDNRKLVYKVDSYCFGRVLNFLTLAYKENAFYSCFNYEIKTKKKLNTIINLLLCDNVYDRITVEECYNNFFT